MAYESVKINGLTVTVQTWTTDTRIRVCEHAQVTVEHTNGDIIQCEGRNYWYNRPWYTFKYQNALMYGARHAYELISQDIKYDYMAEHNWSRITAKRAPQISEYIEKQMYNTPAEVLLYLIKNHDALEREAGYREYDVCRNLDRIEAYNDGEHPLIWFITYEGSGCVWDRSTNKFVG